MRNLPDRLNLRRGIAVHIVIALFVSIIIMGTTYILGSSRTSAAAPLLVRLKADYHMESSFLLLQNRLRWQAPGFFTAKSTLEPTRREIAPGVMLSHQGQQTGTASFRLEARVEGAGIQRLLVAHLEYLPPMTPSGVASPAVAPLQAAIATGAAAEAASDSESIGLQPQGQWVLRYLPPDRLEP